MYTKFSPPQILMSVRCQSSVLMLSVLMRSAAFPVGSVIQALTGPTQKIPIHRAVSIEHYVLIGGKSC